MLLKQRNSEFSVNRFMLCRYGEITNVVMVTGTPEPPRRSLSSRNSTSWWVSFLFKGSDGSLLGPQKTSCRKTLKVMFLIAQRSCRLFFFSSAHRFTKCQMIRAFYYELIHISRRMKQLRVFSGNCSHSADLLYDGLYCKRVMRSAIELLSDYKFIFLSCAWLSFFFLNSLSLSVHSFSVQSFLQIWNSRRGLIVFLKVCSVKFRCLDLSDCRE